MSEPLHNQAPQTAFLSSTVVNDFERVDVAVGLHCLCSRQLKPHDFVEQQGRTEAICGGCHSLVLSVAPLEVENDDEDEGGDE
jgi:hypothetical protein